ncbi:hypothetical protein EB796_022631 [Bugula neritina]|uniref:Uncharacterized protein n=1 Tax=Bugula neritina TaxID=10212 RepID=A0A7J7IZX0_BUGNE|nr:hypothetical protein EB796_022631 [Bugula neritina]
MIEKRTVDGTRLKNIGGVISTHHSVEPTYKWCCHWYERVVVNYQLTPGYIYLHRDTKEMQTTLGLASHCKFEDFNCLLPGNGLLRWKGNITDECLFTKSISIEGEKHGSYFLSNQKDMALSFLDSKWQRTQVCPDTRPELS